MRELLLTLLSLSLSGSLIALLLFAVRPLIRYRLSHRWQYYIWLLVLARLLIPIGPESNLMQAVGNRIETSPAVFGIFSESPGQQEIPGQQGAPGQQDQMYSDNSDRMPDGSPWQMTDYETEGTSEAADRKLSSVPSYAAGNPLQVMRDLPDNVSAVTAAGVFWLGVASAMLFWKLLSYTGLIKEIKKTSVLCEDAAVEQLASSLCRELRTNQQPTIYINNRVPSPMLVGTFRPFIVLPDGCLNSPELRFVLYHELVHYKRKDVLYKWAVQIAVCIHWFNPIVYFVRKEINRNCELACDEAVIGRVDDSEKISYGEAILTSVKPGKAMAHSGISLSMSEDKRLLKERLDAIMKFKKKSRRVVCLTLILTATLFCGATYAGAYRSPDSQTQLSLTGGSEPQRALETITVVGKTWNLINNEEQLRGLGAGLYPMDGKYLLNGDIPLDKAVDWVPIGTIDNPFTGVFNGNGFEITNLTITNREVNVIGMFAFAENAEIYNVTLRNPDLESAFTPGNTIGPVLAFGRNCKSYDNRIIDPVEASDSIGNVDRKDYGGLQTGAGVNVEIDGAIYDLYEPYGLTYRPGQEKLFYNGQVVRYFIDRYNNGQGIRAMWAYDSEGSVDIYAVRNEAGLQGELTGLAAYDQEAFRLRTLEIKAQQNTEPAYDVLTFRFSKEETPEHLLLWIQECEASPFNFQVTDQGGRFYVYVRGAGSADDFGFRSNVSDNNTAMNMEIFIIENAQGDGYALFSVPLYSRFTVSYDGQMKSFTR